LQVDIDDVTFNPTIIQTQRNLTSVSLGGITFSSYQILSFGFPDDLSVRVFDIEDGEIQVDYVENSVLYLGTNGNFTISVHDQVNDHIEGTFNFIGTDLSTQPTKIFTNGSFNIDY